MKNRFERSFRTGTMVGLVAIAAMALGPMALADESYQDFGVTNKFAAQTGTTANIGSIVKIDKQDRCGIQLNVQGDAAGTGLITVTGARSADGVNFETTPKITLISAALNGNTAVVAYTNLSVDVIGAAGYFKVTSISNGDGTANATNCSVWVVKKTVKPSP